MRTFLIALTLLAACGSSREAASTHTAGTDAAPAAEDSVKAVVTKMFDAMRNADSAMLRSVFSPSIIFQTVGTNKEGKAFVRTEKPDGFLASIAQAKPGSLDERIVFESVKIDGPMAMAWTPYSFYYEGKFSHCGVNSFQLVRLAEGWKIQYIIDTRRKTPCAEQE
jgi:hypothetical protein